MGVWTGGRCWVLSGKLGCTVRVEDHWKVWELGAGKGVVVSMVVVENH